MDRATGGPTMLPPVTFAFDRPVAQVIAPVDGPLRSAVHALGADIDWAPPGTAADTPELLRLDADAWRQEDFDLLGFDDLVWQRTTPFGACHVCLFTRDAQRAEELGGRRLLNVTRQVVTRLQRFLRWRNVASATPTFARALALLDRLHDRGKPLVAADHAHALDTWRWTLRLERDASLAVQLAALFHDVERLASEADVRVEQHAADYPAFKAAHARAGARVVLDLMIGIGASADEARRAAALVAAHEGGAPPDRETALLANADALSFFSLNASGFLRYYGPAHTRRKVAYTLARLDAQGRRELARVKLSGAIRRLVDEAVA
jgi:hypothetical protein